MLVECGVRWVVIGHSERRHLFGELDDRVNEKARAALAHGITPIVAVGETAEEHAAGQARDKVCGQVHAAFDGLPVEQLVRCVVAYEPIWAIGTGHADSPASANHIMGEIRALPGLGGARILYGGSMNANNVTDFVAQPNVDGGLVGGASLEPGSFAALLEGARPR
jgi:triosephosphate isomerase